MPTNYTGNGSATQVPSPQPGPGVNPVVALVADGDTRNAASLAQEGKVLADFTAWLTDPFSISAVWNQRLWGVRNSRAQRKWFIDHLGHPAGRIIKWTEDWAQAVNVARDTQFGAGGPTDLGHTTNRGWNGKVIKASGGVGQITVVEAQGFVASPVVTAPPGSGTVLITAGTSVNDVSTLRKDANFVFSADNAAALEMDVWPGATGVSDTQLFAGLGVGPPVAATVGGIFYTDGTANWKAVVGNGSALSAAVNTGVAVAGAAWQQMRVEWWGANVADDSASAMRFYIAGTLVATITTNLPTGLNAALAAGALHLTNATQNASFVGPVQFSVNY